MRIKPNKEYHSSRIERTKEEKNPTRYYSSKQEKSVAEKLNGKCTKNSGATPFQKGDILTEDCLIECKTKTTASNSISIKKEWLEKNNKEALFMGKRYSILAFSFGPNEKNYYILDEDTVNEIFNRI